MTLLKVVIFRMVEPDFKQMGKGCLVTMEPLYISLQQRGDS